MHPKFWTERTQQIWEKTFHPGNKSFAFELLWINLRTIYHSINTRIILQNLTFLTFHSRAIGNSWEKTFSTTTDGFSLHNLYRKLDGFDSPVIFVIEDIENRVFGAVLSCGFKVSENFYGNCKKLRYYYFMKNMFFSRH